MSMYGPQIGCPVTESFWLAEARLPPWIPAMLRQCFAGLHSLASKQLTWSAPLETEIDEVKEVKTERRALWNQAQKLAQEILREWMQNHPGEPVPSDVFQQCQQEIKRSILDDAQTSSFVRFAHLELLRTEGPPPKMRSDEEWRSLFPRYPPSQLQHGFLHCFESSDADGIRRALQTYGFCVVKVLSREECERSVAAMFEEINELRMKKGRFQEGPQIDVEDPNTWADRNWPSSCKFLVDSVALHPQAFVNRCNPKIYEAFSGIFEEKRLHVSVDKWGVARGAKDKPRWRIGLKSHWDVNPWQCLRDFENGHHPGYQGMVALRDQDLETGCHLNLPGCSHFLKQWTLERKLDRSVSSTKSFRAAEDDPLLRYMQPVPLQQGEMVIWSCAQLHGSSHNYSDKMRLSQYIRMFPAAEAGTGINYDQRDGFSCKRVLPRALRKGDLEPGILEGLKLEQLGRCLLGLEEWGPSHAEQR